MNKFYYWALLFPHGYIITFDSFVAGLKLAKKRKGSGEETDLEWSRAEMRWWSNWHRFSMWPITSWLDTFLRKLIAYRRDLKKMKWWLEQSNRAHKTYWRTNDFVRCAGYYTCILQGISEPYLFIENNWWCGLSKKERKKLPVSRHNNDHHQFVHVFSFKFYKIVIKVKDKKEEWWWTCWQLGASFYCTGDLIIMLRLMFCWRWWRSITFMWILYTELISLFLNSSLSAARQQQLCLNK